MCVYAYLAFCLFLLFDVVLMKNAVIREIPATNTAAGK